MSESGRVDETFVHALFTDETGPVGDLVRDIAERGAVLARGLVPWDTGHMEETITSGTSHDPVDGAVRGWWGAGYEAPIPFGRRWKAGFPVINALEAKDHFVWNRSPRRQPHTRGTRRTHPFLSESLDALTLEG